MIHHSKRSNYRGWSQYSLVEAMHAIRDDNISINKAAAKYQIPETTFRRYLKKNAKVRQTTQ